MEKKQFVRKWVEKIAVFLPLFLSGCVTLTKSQENFAKQMSGSGESFAKVLSVASFNTFILYVAWVIGMVVSSIGGHYIVSPYVKTVKKYMNVKAKASDTSALAGAIERVIYSTYFILGWYSIIVILFVFKMGLFVIKYFNTDIKKVGNMANAYILGNLFSLGFALLAGVIIKKLFLRI